MKGILDNYVVARKRSRGKKLRALVALFLLSAMVASSVIWSLRFVGTALSAVPVYEATPQRAVRTSPGHRDDNLPLSPTAKSLSPTPPVSAKAAGEYNLALNKPYVTQYAYHPYMGQLTDGVFEADDAANLLDLKEGTYVGFKKEGDNKAEFSVKLDASVATQTINKIRVHYRTGDSIGSPGTITCYGDGVSKGSAICPASASAGTKSVEISTTGLSTQAQGDTVIKLTFSFESGYEWFYISEVEVITTGTVPQFNVQYYGYVDELDITGTERPVPGGDGTSSTAALPSPGSGTNIASAPPSNGMHTMSINPNLPPMSAKAVKQTISSIEDDGSTATLSVNNVSVSGNIGVLTNGTLASNAGDNLDRCLRSNGTNKVTQLKITLSGKKRISSLKLYFNTTANASWSGVKDITLQESTNGSSWTAVSSSASGSLYTGNNGSFYYKTVTVTTSGNVDTKRLRLSYTNGGFSTGLYEVEVYGDEIPPENWARTGQYKGTEGVPFNYTNGYTDTGVANDAAWQAYHSGELNDNIIADVIGTDNASYSEVGLSRVWNSNTLKLTFKLSEYVKVDNVSVFFLPRNDRSTPPVPCYPQKVEVKVGDTDNADSATLLGSTTVGESNGTYCKKFKVQNTVNPIDGQYVFITITISSDSTGGYVTNITEIQIWGVESSAPPPTTYSVTVIGGTADPSSATEGQTVTLTATPPGGQVLDKWTVNYGGVALSSENASVTTFTMPAHDVSVTASFTLPCINTIVDTRYYSDGRSRYGNDGDPGGVMPENDGNGAQRYNLITVPLTGSTDNATLKTKDTKDSLVKIYRDNYYYTDAAPKVENVNILATNSDWAFKEIWKLKSNKSPESTTESDWTKITGTSDALMAKNFTNDISITDGDVIRLVFDPVEKPNNFVHEDTHFFDYDITEAGQKQDEAFKTSAQTGSTWHGLGINKPSPMVEFYDETDNQDEGTNSGTHPFLAFGNANTGVCYQNLYWEDGNHVKNRFNQFNNNNQRPCVPGGSKSLNGATFGLVKDHLLLPTEDGFSYNNGLDFNVTTNDTKWKNDNGTYSAAPSMFRRRSQGAKRRHFDDMSISFTQKGDTYIIDSVGEIDGSEDAYLSGLGHFKFTVNYSGTSWPIYSNSFWAMNDRTITDLGVNQAANDPKGGQGSWYGFAKTYGASGSTANQFTSSTFPEKDGGGAENSYFGMNFDIEFDLSEDYVGPLNYFFYGDDDLWVYLDGILVCDIGGVHSSIGEYVNLWDTLSPYNIGRHKLSVFYTERGASGSSCYMRFNLPGVTAQPPAAQSSALLISKECTGPVDPNTEFTFEVTLKDDQNNPYPPAGESLTVQRFKSYEDYYDNITEGNALTSVSITSTNRTITVKSGGIAVIDKLPEGVTYTVKELNTTGYNVTACADRVLKTNTAPPSHEPSTSAALIGTTDKEYRSTEDTQIDGDYMCSRVHFVNFTSAELPSTGGVGRELVPVLGLTAVIFSSLAPVVLRDKSNRKQRRAAK